MRGNKLFHYLDNLYAMVHDLVFRCFNLEWPLFMLKPMDDIWPWSPHNLIIGGKSMSTTLLPDTGCVLNPPPSSFLYLPTPPHCFP